MINYNDDNKSLQIPLNKYFDDSKSIRERIINNEELIFIIQNFIKSINIKEKSNVIYESEIKQPPPPPTYIKHDDNNIPKYQDPLINPIYSNNRFNFVDNNRNAPFDSDINPFSNGPSGKYF